DLDFLQHADDWLFAEPPLLHETVSPATLPLTLQWDTPVGKGRRRNVASWSLILCRKSNASGWASCSASPTLQVKASHDMTDSIALNASAHRDEGCA
ncbi:hypothetical protein KPG66_05230, partial [Mycetohabitans sp. B2]|uniref:hypothetical protein n=1 Tax=Mycetohabitans sp. B2 TaxID=2841274 RepID=UPI001F1A5C94